MGRHKKWATAGVAITIVSLLTACGQTTGGNDGGTTSGSHSTSNAVTNSATTATNTTNTTNTTNNTVQPGSSATMAKMTKFRLGDYYSIDIPVHAQRTGPYPTDGDAHFWTDQGFKIGVYDAFNPTNQTLQQTLHDYETNRPKGQTISSTSQGNNWFLQTGTIFVNGVQEKFATKVYVGQMILVLNTSYPLSQSSQYDVLAQKIISSFLPGTAF